MSNIEIMNEKALSMAELREELNTLKERDTELSFRGKKVEEYLNNFVKIDAKKGVELRKKLSELGIARLKDRHISKVIDIMPKEVDSLRLIFSGENLTLKTEDLDKILAVVKEFC